ncbi:cation channel sperm-associated auxiliary subunit TMEM249 [Saimiri boliviensis]|uniref:cation channel sperm-associated auxiliary subunit TMEM249 n=1 Tax=Saimiri boliviensis TaxID=27679 RepID=UPI00193DBC7A|nr:transmembrane protein 249 [Saimiri boliviensis boliviensis]
MPKGQVHKGRTRGLLATSFGWRFRLWSLGLFCPERHLARRLKNNSFFPFEQQQPNGARRAGRVWGGGSRAEAGMERSRVGRARGPGRGRPVLPGSESQPARRSCRPEPCADPAAPGQALAPPPRLRGARASSHAAPPLVFVLEYYLDTLWKGMLLFVVCVVLVSVSSLRKVQKQETWVFPAYGVAVGLWMVVSSLPRRRLVLNHPRGVYHFSIQGRAVCQGPLHLVYVRLAFSSDAYGRCFFQLVLGGHRLEPLVLVQLSEHYEQMEYLGRYMARKLNINYFDYMATSYRHVVRHWPPSSARTVSHKSLVGKHSSSQSNLEV